MTRIVTGLILLLFLCPAPALAQAERPPEELSWSLTVPQGLSFAVGLPANPTTGFQWRLGEGLTADVLWPEGANYLADCPEGVLGCGGVMLFRFRAKGRGTVSLILTYSRPWEPERIARRAVVRVEVK